MNLEIVVINARHWTSKIDNKVYNTLDFVINSKDNLVESDNFKGYQVVTSWLKRSVVKEIIPFGSYKATFDTTMFHMSHHYRLEHGLGYCNQLGYVLIKIVN